MSGGKLPEGWVGPQLDEIATDINYGYTASSTSENIGPKMLRITDIQDNKVDWNSVPFCKIEDNQKNKYLLCNGDLVFARTGATVGKSFLINEDISNIVFASYLIRVRCNKKINSHYLSYFFRSPTYWSQITEFSAGIGQPNVNGSKLKKLNLPLTSVYEQKIIAEKLDTLLAQVDSTKARLEQIPQILKRFRQAVLAAAASGRLTNKWRENYTPKEEINLIASKYKPTDSLFKQAKLSLPEIPQSWYVVPSAHLIDYVTSGSRGWANYYSTEGALFLRMSNVRYNTTRLDLQDLQFVNLPGHVEGKRSLVKIDDLIISLTADVGRVARIDKDLGEAYINQHLALLRPTNNINSEYFALCIAAQNIGVKQIQSLKRGATKVGLGLDDIRSLAIPLPPFPEQLEIVRRVEQLFAYADTIEKQVNNVLTRVNNLTQSILAKAFRGELTAQWRAENPDLISGENSAAALLEKIKAERATSDGKKTSRKKS